jgi:histidine triad (HIT) family protein
VFCSIASGSAPGRPVLEAPQAIAFLDINPATDGHTLVVPRHHAEDIFDLDEETAAAVWQSLSLVDWTKSCLPTG